MWHTAAYSGTIAFNSSNAVLPAAPDGILRVGQQNGFVLQQPMALLAAWAAPANGTAFRLFAPKPLVSWSLVGPTGPSRSGPRKRSWPTWIPGARLTQQRPSLSLIPRE